MGHIYLGDVAPRVKHPDTEFAVVQIAGDHDQVFLSAHCTSEDTRTPGQDFTVSRGRVVPAYYDTVREAACACRELMHYIACHEVDEKLCLDGQPVFDPHENVHERSERP